VSDPRYWTQATIERFQEILDQKIEEQFPGYLAEQAAREQELADRPIAGTWEEVIREKEGQA
jgi:hypothetical protein